jgi:hypothetical protein
MAVSTYITLSVNGMMDATRRARHEELGCLAAVLDIYWAGLIADARKWAVLH